VNRFALHIDDGNRSFGRNARDIAPNEFIKHYVAEYKDVLATDGFQNFFRALFS